MTVYLSHLKDVIGNNYLGIKIYPDLVSKYLEELKEVEPDYDIFIKNQQDRDRGQYHITVINVGDYNRLSKEMGADKFLESIDLAMKYEIDDLKLMGLGTASRNTNKAYFVVCQSDKLDAIRNRYNLPKQDFHITLAFSPKDVFGVRKNEVIKKDSKFLKLLSEEYLRKENFNFIRKIGNYSMDIDLDIIPISLDEKSLKVKVGNELMCIGLVDDRLWIVAQFKDGENLPRLPITDLLRSLKK